jgi:hypothetical protein
MEKNINLTWEKYKNSKTKNDENEIIKNNPEFRLFLKKIQNFKFFETKTIETVKRKRKSHDEINLNQPKKQKVSL